MSYNFKIVVLRSDKVVMVSLTLNQLVRIVLVLLWNYVTQVLNIKQEVLKKATFNYQGLSANIQQEF